MLLVEWLPAAEDDLLTILTYIAENNVQAATDLQIRVDRALRHLGANPYLYKPSDRIDGAREIVISANYILFYQVTSKIEVLTIVHVRRQFPK
jgi:plasmid stabilization system protein ParE